MTSTQQHGIFHDRVKNSSDRNLAHLECPICQYVLWKPVACQSCETPFCSFCINRSLTNNPGKCPQRCEPYKERKCPPLIAKLLAELQIDCFYKSTGCQQVLSYEALDKHEIECDYQPKQCPGCQSQILKKDFDHHIRNCASIELTCEDCKLVYKRGEAATEHTEIICLREESRRNKSQIQALSLQLSELYILIPSLGKARITFDDLPDAIERYNIIPSAYRGLNWTGIYCGRKSFFKEEHPKSGYVTEFNTGCSPHIAYFKEQASIAIEDLNRTFTFISITACAAYNDDLKLTITGYRNSAQTNTHATTLLFGQPQVILLQWKDIDKITFEPSGGTARPGIGGGGGTQVVITQLTIVVPNAS